MVFMFPECRNMANRAKNHWISQEIGPDS